MSCLIFLMLLVPGFVAIMSIIKQSQDDNESLQGEASNYNRISYRNNPYNNYNQNNYNQSNYNQNNYNQSNYNQNNYNQSNYNQNNYNQSNYNQNNYNRPQLANPYSNEKLSLYFTCRAPINVERYNSCIVELIDDHGRNMYLLKFQNPISKFKLAKVTFHQVRESDFYANKGKSIGQGRSLIKQLRIKFLIHERPRLEISLPLPFTYCIGIDNPIRYFNVSIHDRANKNTNENFNIYLTRDEMSIISAREGKNSFETPKKEAKQKVISLDNFNNISDEELVNQLFKTDYLKGKKQNAQIGSTSNLEFPTLGDTTDVFSSKSDLSLPSPMSSKTKTSQRTISTSAKTSTPTTNTPSETSSISSSILRDSSTRSRTTERRNTQEDDIFANAFNKQEQSKSSYEAYKEHREQQQKEIEALDEKVELIEEETPMEEIPTDYEASFDDELVELVQDEPVYEENNYSDYEQPQEETEPEIYFVTDEEELLEVEPEPAPIPQIEEPQEEKKEEIASDVDSVLNKYSKSKPKFKTSSFISPTSNYTTSSYKSESTNTNEQTKSKTSDFSSKYMNKYSKYTKFGE